ncbi:response regulator receiver domain [uncultured Desulfosarcina sp.]|uniref:response regulator receiver domain n=1 Tax=uncultured Desulfosarcina sp. TaxID=218289 RepID=UPI0029C63474|nr:response regulator receiver domain [uncultured Desulfosarcina sp.]
MNYTSEFFVDSVAAASNFIQTAVIIDDKLFEKFAGEPPKKLKETKSRKHVIRRKDDGIQKIKSDEISDDPHNVDTQDLIRAFAKKSIVCAAYQPKHRDFSTGSTGDFRKLCKNADIVIVDWSMFADNGQRAKKLIAGIVTENLRDTPEQLRLIIAYTGEPNLFNIENQIFTHLQSIDQELPSPEKEENLAVRFGSSRIIVLGKKNGRGRLEKYQSHEVTEVELAERAIQEYAIMTCGLMSNVALRSVAALRSNTRKIISNFSPKLDAAFLTHRVLSLPDENAESHLLEMMSSEFYAVIEDSFQTDLVSKKAVVQWLDHKKEILSKGLEEFGQYPKESQPHDDLKQLCVEGADFFCDSNNHPFQVLKKINAKGFESRNKLSKVLSGKTEYVGDYQLACSMALRTFYSNKARTLTLGTLLQTKSENGKNYWVCVQPRCDSVRLDDDTRFPFLRCDIVAEEDYRSKRSVVLFENGHPICLKIDCKPNRIKMLTFKPDSSKRIVSKPDLEKKRFVFKALNGMEFYWRGELKFEHAQRIAQELSGQLSRVGLAESEWLLRYKK